MRELRAVCVYCGSSSGADAGYAALAADVGRRLAREGITLVYGGSAVGLMRELADAALGEGGRVIGVTPRSVFRAEVAHRGLTELFEVDSMHDRKLLMFELADAFVALPGGIGTLEELTEVASWGQLGLHEKPVVTLDVDGFWRPFHDFLDAIVAAGLLKPRNRALVGHVDDPARVLEVLRARPVETREPVIGLDET
jgi:uncharacterized protein (TIGR00730 family)